MTNNNDEIYAQDIEPLIERISLICKQENIPLFLSCSGAEKKTLVTGININEDSLNTLNLHKQLSESKSIDEFLSRLVALSEKFGHNSSLLSLMGIPRKPNPEVKVDTTD